MSSELFAGMPSINIPRSRWNNGSCVSGTMNHGLLTPVDFIPILPGDSMNYKFRDITRMVNNPVAPMFGNLKKSIAAFFVPYRLIWKHTEEYFGANKTSSGPQTTTYELPYAQFTLVNKSSLSHYLGKPWKDISETDVDGKNYYSANILKERAYYLIWSEYFRASSITNPVLLNTNDCTDANAVQTAIGTWNGTQLDPRKTGDQSLMKVAKQFDVFTACTLSPQFGSAVELPLGSTASVIADGDLKLKGASDTTVPSGTNMLKTKTDSSAQSYLEIVNPGAGVMPSGNLQYYSGLKVDLSTATAAKVNDVRYAFQLQKYLELSNFSSNYFFSILQVHYGVTSPDSRLQRPEFLGEFSEDILVHQVTSTADTTNNNVLTPIGHAGATSVTASGTVSLFDKAFVEPGLVCIVQWCRQRQVYSQGVMKEDFIKDRFEIYSPEFCNLGDDFVRTRELYWKAGESSTAIFGYQEHWYQNRYRFDRCVGELDPAASGTLSYYSLGNNFTSVPQLNDTFIMEQPDNLRRCLVVTDGSVPDYVFDIYQDITWTREMPVRTLPGLIDHFGAM